MDSEEALELANEVRDENGGYRLYENTRSELNDQLCDFEPYDLLTMGYDEYEDYFYLGGWGDEVEFTSDPWYDVDVEDLAREIESAVEEEEHIPYFDYLPREILDLCEEYEEARKLLGRNPHRVEGEELLARYTNCEADVTDLLQYISRITKNDEVWAEEEE